MSELKEIINSKDVQSKLKKMLGENSQTFATSLMQTVTSSDYLIKCNPNSLMNAALTSAALKLPINNNLGFAWIVPFKNEAQLQIGWKGFVQLALRTCEYQKINVISIQENQFKSYNKMTEFLDCDFNIDGKGKTVGYAAYFLLKNGFEKTCYWSKEEVEIHAKTYSKTYKNPYGVWQKQFDAMAKKTVLKNTLSKWGIMSIDMQNANIFDQSVIENESPKYVDNPQFKGEDISKNTIEVEVLDTKTWFNPNTKRWESAVNKNSPIEKIKEFFKISKENEAKYINELAEKYKEKEIANSINNLINK